MATGLAETVPRLASYQTALAIVPPAHLAKDINTLRAAYDKAHEKWPAHINLLYPFVSPESLPAVLPLVRSALTQRTPGGLGLKLDGQGCFAHKHSSTIFLFPEDDTGLQQLRAALLRELDPGAGDALPFRPHLTVGQAGTANHELRESLLAKARLLPVAEWGVTELAVLVRGEDRAMRLWGTIAMDALPSSGGSGAQPAEGPAALSLALSPSPSRTDGVQRGTTYRFDAAGAAWRPLGAPAATRRPDAMPPSFQISSYNVLVDSIFPPARERFDILLGAILADAARADVLVLQEVADDFLSHLLRSDHVRQQYPYASHAPPEQPDVGPLLSLRNIVILSRWSFAWQLVPFERRHKGAVVATFTSIGAVRGQQFHPLVVAGVHLTCGLTDGAVAAKKSQLRTLAAHLSRSYPESPWIVAGDFNVTTSTRTVEDALRTRSISTQTAKALESLETLLVDAGLADAWAVARSGHSKEPDTAVDADDVAEGEQGATFDPGMNPLAAEIVGHGVAHRPQRYDRILVKGQAALKIGGFNMFGHPDTGSSATGPLCGSDHWGIRATLKLRQPSAPESAEEDANTSVLQPVRPPQVLDAQSLEDSVLHHPTFPRREDEDTRKEIFAMVRSILQPIAGPDNKIPLVIVPVGSYGLGVWTTSSDIDCLCISSVSSKTFFALAVRHLRRSATQGVRILRKVEAHSGTMLELEIRGVRLDLQYCAAPTVAQCWPEPLSLPATDPLFSMPYQTLSKLKAIRDLTHLLQTTPDLPAFRTAYRFLVLWATSRGIYAARFGFLSGTHISFMLNRVVKLLYHQQGTATAADIVCTFFRYYAAFAWEHDIVEDPFARSAQGMGGSYHRRAGEPMVVVGFHVPRVNVARAASVPALRAVSEELQRADRLLSVQEGSDGGLSWGGILGTDGGGAREFLEAYRSYIRIDVQYWGASSAKGRGLVGWIESRCPMLLVDINRRTPEIHARIWPARFTRDEDNETNRRDHHGCYLIGLARRKELDTGERSEADRRVGLSKLTAALDRFAAQIRSNESSFDPASAWVDVAHVRQSHLGNLRLDSSGWGSEPAEGELDFEDDDDDEEDEEAEMAEGGVTGEVSAALADAAEEETRTSSSRPAGRKLRPATDILNRLRWDPNLDSNDYVVGYVDRFVGTREIALDRWKLEQTDDEFIPQHRILYFKRRSDGVKVWDRGARKDELFGAGGARQAR